jgi:hypothetical protein
MSYGLEVTNGSGQVLISSEFKNLHFVQKSTTPDYVDINSNGLFGGAKVMRYRVSVNETPVPFFHVPVGSSCAVTAVRSVSAGVWDIEVLTDGVNPEIYVFATTAVVASGDTHGVQVFNSSNEVTFDSRSAPLLVTGLLSIGQPSQPSSSYSSSGLSSDSCSTGVSTYSNSFIPNNTTSYSTPLPTKPIFFFSSNAQAEREIHVSTSETVCDGVSIKGNCVGFERDYYYDSYYWAFYRNVISWSSGSVGSTWCVANWGCHWTYEKDSTSFGIGTGGSSISGGSWPYSNETINTFNNTVLVGDASYYD